MNIALLLEMAGDSAPDRIGLVCDGKRWSYRELRDAARGAAELIAASGACHVALLDESSEAAVIALFGAALAGVPYCPLNYRLADTDLAALLLRIAPALVVGDVARVERLAGGQGYQVYSRADFTAAAQGATVPEGRDYDSGEGIASSSSPAARRHHRRRQSFATRIVLSYILGTVEFASADECDAALCLGPALSYRRHFGADELDLRAAAHRHAARLRARCVGQAC